MKFPDFIVIGAYKAGTTALWYNLDKHPDITMCKGGSKTESLGTEINFWHGRNWDKGLKWYKSSFVGDFCGEKSPGYMHSYDAMKSISECMPDVKLVIALRNPVDRAYSSFQVGVRRGRTKSKLTYDQATTGKLFGMSDYSGILEKSILPFFPKQNIHCVVSEWSRKDINAELGRLHEFLGMSVHASEVDQFDNPGNLSRATKLRSADNVSYIVHNLTERTIILSDLQVEIGPHKKINLEKIADRAAVDRSCDLKLALKTKRISLRSRVSKNANPVHAKRDNYQDWKSKYKSISGDLRQKLLDFYKSHNDKLFDFLGYDIPEWSI